tara:strand:- start:790 stop:1437 length:648 start_codon:yes stop_codon:yes gene_type:complete
MGYNMKNSPINKGYAAKPSPLKEPVTIAMALGKFAASAAGKAAISGAAGAVVSKAADALGKGKIGEQNDPFGGVKMGTDDNPIKQDLSKMPYHSKQRYMEYKKRNWAQDHTTSGYSQPQSISPIQPDLLSSNNVDDTPTTTTPAGESGDNNVSTKLIPKQPLWEKGKEFLDQGIVKLAVNAGITKLFQSNKEYKPGDYSSNFSKMQLGVKKDKNK